MLFSLTFIKPLAFCRALGKHAGVVGHRQRVRLTPRAQGEGEQGEASSSGAGVEKDLNKFVKKTATTFAPGTTRANKKVCSVSQFCKCFVPAGANTAPARIASEISRLQSF